MMFYFAGTTTETYHKIEWGEKKHFIIANDSTTNALCFNFDGGMIDMVLKANEALEFQYFCESRTIYVKDYVAGVHINFRIFAW